MAEEFELRRSSRAQVSQTVAAINDDRSRLVEDALGIAHQFRQREMNRALDRGAAMLMLRQHIDDLPARGKNLQHLAMIDNSHFMGCYLILRAISASCASAVSTSCSPVPAATRAVATS
jgi:hypothetical protein